MRDRQGHQTAIREIAAVNDGTREAAALLWAIGGAILERAERALHRRYFYDCLAIIAARTWVLWGSEATAAGRVAALQELAKLDGTQAHEFACIIAEDVAAGRSDLTRELLIRYLALLPSTIRIIQRRPDDPRGLTTPDWLAPRRPEQLELFLPSAIPKHRPGEWPWPTGDWVLTDLLGVGGFGEVWKATNFESPIIKPIVIKFCVDPKRGGPYFRHEAAILAQLKRDPPHSGIVGLRSTDFDRNPPCLMFEYIEGGDLHQWYRGRPFPDRPISSRLATRIILRLARIVSFCHGRSSPIVHRDLKPSNILIRRSNGKLSLKICDFGIGGLADSTHASRSDAPSLSAMNDNASLSRRLIRNAVMKGAHSAMYAPPQQAKGQAPNPRDDVFALGVIWYQLLVNDLTRPIPPGYQWVDEIAEARGLSERQVELIANCVAPQLEMRPLNALMLCREIISRFPDHLRPRPRPRPRPQSKPQAAALEIAPPIPSPSPSPAFAQAPDPRPATVPVPAPSASVSERPAKPNMTPPLRTVFSLLRKATPPQPQPSPLPPSALNNVKGHDDSDAVTALSPQPKSRPSRKAGSIWDRGPDGLIAVSASHLQDGPLRMLASAFKPRGFGRSAQLARKLEEAMRTGVFAKELIWDLARAGQADNSEGDLVRALAGRLFGQPLPALFDERERRSANAEADYSAWLDRVCPS